jgi:cell division protein FtsW (lipid II flippase)
MGDAVPQMTNSFFTRKHLIILLIALLLALGFMLVRADRAAAQITGTDYQNAVTLERLMILGMLGLVILTWFYLKWRPPPDHENDHPVEPDRE